MIKRFVQCVACRSFRTENGEDVARRVSQLEAENARLREALKVISQNRTDERRIYTEGCECDDFARAALELVSSSDQDG